MSYVDEPELLLEHELFQFCLLVILSGCQLHCLIVPCPCADFSVEDLNVVVATVDIGATSKELERERWQCPGPSYHIALQN